MYLEVAAREGMSEAEFKLKILSVDQNQDTSITRGGINKMTSGSAMSLVTVVTSGSHTIPIRRIPSFRIVLMSDSRKPHFYQPHTVLTINYGCLSDEEDIIVAQEHQLFDCELTYHKLHAMLPKT